VKAGGDIAAMLGLCKCIVAKDDEARANGRKVLDRDFIEQHTHGFEAFEAMVRGTVWAAIEAASGLSRTSLEAAAQVYVESERTVAFYGMGLTQHAGGFDNVAMLINLLLLKGNIGRDGTGICPVRGHSNVQGQRTVGISEKPELVPLDKLAAMYDFEPPRWKGMATVETCEAVLAGKVSAFIAMGGNFVRAIPEREAMEAAWTQLKLTVGIGTKLNRSHLLPGEVAFLLPCLGRSEEDRQVGGRQVVAVEDSLSCVHGSTGHRAPASEHLMSELAIVAGIAKAALPPNPTVEWDRWVGDYGIVRDRIEETYPEFFSKFNERLFVPGGFYRGNTARERIWKTESGKAEFSVPKSLSATGFEDVPGRWRLITLRSNDQFNTTIYGYSDRLRGVEGTRDVLLINPCDIERAGLREGQVVSLIGDAEDGKERVRPGVKVMPFDLPDGCIATYYPEANPLLPLSHHDGPSKTPAAKAIPVRIRP
jgi:molybdopterin-dependent oxidoreductase alpha subunit